MVFKKPLGVAICAASRLPLTFYLFSKCRLPLYRYKITPYFFHTYIRLYQISRSPLCRYEISPHFLTRIFDCIKEAARRYAAMRLALIFYLYIWLSKKPLAALPL